MAVEFGNVPAGSAGLGTNANTVTRHRSREAFRTARRDRFARRVVSRRWLLDDASELHGSDDAVKLAARPATCGWAAGEAVGVHRAEGGPARFSGVQTCASVWGCACCGSLIRSRRSEEVQQAAQWWEGQGGTFLFLTLTVRHYLEDSLERTMDALTEGFRSTINGAPWKRFTRRHGIRHWIKAQEVTLGWENGWHAHLHVLLFVDFDGAAQDLRADLADAQSALSEARDGRSRAAKRRRVARLSGELAEALRIAEQGISRERERELHSWLSDRWRTMVVAAGGREPSKRRGVDIRTVRDGNVVGLYISKLQEGDRERGWAVGQEMARQDLKKGRLDSLVPLELLDIDGLTEEQAERQRVYWLEYVAATKGRRSMTWSRGLKEAAGVEDVDDDQIVAEEAEQTEEDDRVLIIRAKHWRAVRDDADVLARILELVEQDRASEVASLVSFEWPPPIPEK